MILMLEGLTPNVSARRRFASAIVSGGSLSNAPAGAPSSFRSGAPASKAVASASPLAASKSTIGKTATALNVSIESVCRDYFRHLTVEKLLRKVLAGQIKLPIVRIEDSQKAARGVHLSDLAEYIDRQRAKAIKESLQLSIE